MKCKICGNDEFIGHQITRADIKVDENGEFLEDLEGGLKANIYDYGKSYGPFTCTRCGAEYDELKDGEEPISPPNPDWQKADNNHEKTVDGIRTSEVFRWLADHDNTDEMFQLFAEMDLDGVLEGFSIQDIIQKVSRHICVKKEVSHNNDDHHYIQNIVAVSLKKSKLVSLNKSGFIMSLCFETPGKDFDIKRAVMEAAADFCKTLDGRKIFEYYNGNSFTWIDFAKYVPEEICVKHGFRIIGNGIGTTLAVDCDKQLVDYLDLEE